MRGHHNTSPRSDTTRSFSHSLDGQPPAGEGPPPCIPHQGSPWTRLRSRLLSSQPEPPTPSAPPPICTFHFPFLTLHSSPISPAASPQPPQDTLLRSRTDPPVEPPYVDRPHSRPRQRQHRRDRHPRRRQRSAVDHPAKTKKDAPPKVRRGTIESIIFALLMAFLFRTFEAGAFVIPPGSMAPTLYGRHKEVHCHECGYPIVVGAR